MRMPVRHIFIRKARMSATSAIQRVTIRALSDSPTLEFQTSSDEETIDLGRRIAQMLPPKAVVLLIGDLGAGKTTLAKGIISGLGAAQPDDVASPTFTLIHEYGSASTRLVYHIDLYRLDHAAQVATLGLDELFEREAVVLIEWGERFPGLLPTNLIRIHLDPDADHPQVRNIRIAGLTYSTQ
jgi:tRNA threonylcarbamoyladenosine biosynthesis protein TsaE